MTDRYMISHDLGFPTFSSGDVFAGTKQMYQQCFILNEQVIRIGYIFKET